MSAFVVCNKKPTAMYATIQQQQKQKRKKKQKMHLRASRTHSTYERESANELKK